ncbi:MAG: hypothetical protein WBF42_18990 [Terracidiphilus sp.]
MSAIDSLRTGLRFFLMSLGISSQIKKPQPPAQPSGPATGFPTEPSAGKDPAS